MITEPHRNGLVRLSDYHRIRDMRTGDLYDEAVVRPEDRRFFEETDIPLEGNGDLPPEEPPTAAEPESAPVPDEKQQRIAALEQELAALRQTP